MTHRYFLCAVVLAACASCGHARQAVQSPPPAKSARSFVPRTRGEQLASLAERQVGLTTSYSPRYEVLRYPNGDLPIARGVCSDVVVRALRGQRVDLQRLVHEDMSGAFGAYPRLWGLRRPDPNIDHRRVPNLATYLRRAGKARRVSARGADYAPGDIVVWRLTNGRPHIGVVSNAHAADADRPLVVHNIGAGAQMEDVLFAWKVEGVYRYWPKDPGDR